MLPNSFPIHANLNELWFIVIVNLFENLVNLKKI